MDVPLVVCYNTQQAVKILRDNGINNIEILKTRANDGLDEFFREERVICQRERNGTVQLIVC